MYAVFLDGNKQVKAAEGDSVLIDHRDAEPGSTLDFDRVLICAGGTQPIIGSPHIPNARVVGEVQAHEKGPKLHVQHLRRRKDSRRRVGHRQMLTRIVVREIVVPGAVELGAAKGEPNAPAPPAAPEDTTP